MTSQQPTFTQLASLSATSLPAGVKATFDPPQITAGATSTLSVSLSDVDLAPGSYSFTLGAAADVEGKKRSKTAPATLNVVPAAQTTLSGRVLSTANEPIMGATASLDGKTATTDAAGAFLLIGVTAGVDRPVMIDGRTASAPNRTYPVINEAATVIAGQANVVPHNFYLPPIDIQYEVEVMPNRDTTATTPRLPDYKLTVPAGANLRNRDGSPVTRMSVTPLPIDRIPAPLPPNATTAEVWTAQPGGALSDIQIPVTYPNDMHADPGTQCDLYVFDHDNVRWRIYGTGHVSADGRTVVPDTNPATGRPYGLDNFAWHFLTQSQRPDEPKPCIRRPTTTVPLSCNDDCAAQSSKPVDLATGNKIEMATDISFGGVRGQLELTRVHTTNLAVNNYVGRFGRGMKDNYDITLTGTFSVNGAGRFVSQQERNGRLFSYAGTDSTGALLFKTSAIVGQLGDVVRKLNSNTFEYRYADGCVLRFASIDLALRLVALIDPNGNTTTLSYTGSNLTRITDPTGRSITLDYDGSNRVTRATDPLGRIWQYSYDSGGRLSKVTDPLLNNTQYTYDGFGRLTSVTDQRGIVIKQITYDGNGRVSTQQFADGGSESYSYTQSGTVVTGATVTDPLGRTISKRFNAAGYAIGTTDELGQSSVIERDMTNNLPLSITGPCGCPEVTYSYDSDRGIPKPLAVTDRLGQITRYVYEPVFLKASRITDPLGHVTNYGYDAHGNLTSVTNALNQTTTYSYDGNGQLISITDPLGHTSRMEYDANGNVTARVDALGNRTTMEYDGIGRLTATIDPLGRRTGMEYDVLGRIASVTDPAGAKTSFTYDANGNQVSTTNALGKIWTRVYDTKNRLLAAIDPLGRATRYTYNSDDELIAVTSPSGRKTRYTYDPRGQRATITDPLSGVVQYTYDNRGNLATLTDQRGNTTTFAYDELFRQKDRRDPLGKTSSVSYDAAGNVTERIDRLGRRTTTEYDALNRPTRITYADAVVTYTYDAAGRRTRVDDTQGGSIQWSYDEANRLLSETTPAGVVSYTYNEASQRASMTAADRPPVTYSYDPAGRLKTITQGQETFTYSYDTLSRLNSLQRPNGVKTTYSYNVVNRLEHLTHTNGQNQPIEDFRYSYNADDEIASITSLASAQLLPAARTVSTADAANRIAQFGQSSFSFNDEGQTMTKTDGQGTTSYSWDARGRLTRAALPNSFIISYRYDALGRRMGQVAGGVATSLLYDNNDIV